MKGADRDRLDLLRAEALDRAPDVVLVEGRDDGAVGADPLLTSKRSWRGTRGGGFSYGGS